MMQLNPGLQNSLLEINRQRDIIIFDYLKGFQDKFTVLPSISNNLSLIPEMNANLSQINASLIQMTELMQRMVGCIPKPICISQKAVHTVDIILQPTEKGEQKSAE